MNFLKAKFWLGRKFETRQNPKAFGKSVHPKLNKSLKALTDEVLLGNGISFGLERFRPQQFFRSQSDLQLRQFFAQLWFYFLTKSFCGLVHIVKIKSSEIYLVISVISRP